MTNNQAFEVKKAIDSAFTDDEEDLIPLSLLSKRLLTSRPNKRTSTSEDESSPKKKCEGSVTVNHAEISKEFNRLKELLEPSFPLMPSIRALVPPDMDTDAETTLTANESATEVENFNESTPKPTKVTPTARKSFPAARSPPTPLAFEPQTPPISEPDTEPQQERPTVPQPLNIFNFNLSDDVPTI
ncbi:fibronectin-binding protein A-like [Rhopilema esculentum]|uniref:fibronectin-binding protein A-like n=1 Tax=Rhopilema esculentum TaxID=499914 RepID=UPI0031D9A8D0